MSQMKSFCRDQDQFLYIGFSLLLLPLLLLARSLEVARDSSVWYELQPMEMLAAIGALHFRPMDKKRL